MSDFHETETAAKPVAKLNHRIREALADCFVEILSASGFPEPEKLKPKFMELLEKQP